MKPARRQRFASPAASRELARLRTRLAEAEQTLLAIRTGEVDAVVVSGKLGPRVFTLDGAGRVYRALVESMNEGALTLTAGKMVLYANQRFAKMVKCPLEQVIGSSFRRFLSAADRERLRPLLKPANKSGSKIHVQLNAGDGSQMPVQISVHALERNRLSPATLGMVVTDMTESRNNEQRLRALSHGLVRAQEAERGRVALELHDHVTQLLCAILVRSQALADNLSARDRPSRLEAIKLREMLGQTADEVERISRNLRPSVLDELGLAAVMRDAGVEFADRTGVRLKLECVQLTARLEADTELTFYRIFQEALKNVEQHAHARHVTVCLKLQGRFVQLTINDDGIGFEPGHSPTRRNGKSGVGLLSMRERATSVDGALNVASVPGKGTTVTARVPLIHRTPPHSSNASSFIERR